MNVRNCFHFKTFLLFCKKNKSRCCVLGGKPFHLARAMFMIMYLLKVKKGK